MSQRVLKRDSYCLLLAMRCLLLASVVWSSSFAAKEYDGDACSGIVNFQLRNGTDVEVLDAIVADSLNGIPMYLTYDCASSLRRVFCLQVYGDMSDDSIAYCSNVCDSVIQTSCSTYFKHFNDATAIGLRDTLEQCIGSTNVTDCHAGGAEQAERAADTPRCPNPFIPTQYSATYPVEGTGCAASCEEFPTLESWEWDVIYAVYQYTCIAGLAAGVYSVVLFTIKTTLLSKQRTSWTTIHVLLFSSGCVCATCALFTVAFPSPKGAFCEHSVVETNMSPLCLAQGAIWTWFNLWTSVWVIIQSFELYAKIVKGFSTARMVWFQRAYPAYAVGIPTILVFSMLILDGIAYDQDTGIPFCVPSMQIMYSQHVLYYMPQALFCVISTVFFVAALRGSRKIINIRRLHQTNQLHQAPSFASAFDGLSDDRQSSYKMQRVIQKFIGINLQTLTLHAVYTTGVLYFSVWRLIDTVHKPQREKSLDEWTECVFQRTTTDPSEGQTTCGSTPSDSPALTPILITVLFACGYGMLPFFAFAYGLHCGPNSVYDLLRMRNEGRRRSNSSIVLDKGAQGIRGGKMSSSDVELVEQSVAAYRASTSEVEADAVPMVRSARSGSTGSVLEVVRARVQSSNISRASSMEFEQFVRIKVNGSDVAEVQGPLGAGGFGLVYRVCMVGENGKHAAMKCAKFEARGQLKRADLELCHEARICLSLGRHNHIVSLRYVCRDESLSTSDSLQRFLLFYDLVEGPDMKVCLEQRCASIFRTTDPAAVISERLAKYAQQLLSAVAYMHSKDVIHEDIKPENILVDKRGFIKVADFGLSSQGKRERTGRRTLKAPLQGFTASYRSPEIAKHAAQFQAATELSKPQPSGRYRSINPVTRSTKHHTSRVSTKEASSATTAIVTPAASDVWATALTIFEMFMVGTVGWSQHRGETGFRVIAAYEGGTQVGEPWDWTYAQFVDWFSTQQLPAPVVAGSPPSSNAMRQSWISDTQELEQIMMQACPGIKRAAIIRVRNKLRSTLQFSIPAALLNVLKLSLVPTMCDRPQDGQEMLDLIANEQHALQMLSAVYPADQLQPIVSQRSQEDGDAEIVMPASSRLQRFSETTSLRFGQDQEQRCNDEQSLHVLFTDSTRWQSAQTQEYSARTNDSMDGHSAEHKSDTTGMSSIPDSNSQPPEFSDEVHPVRLSTNVPLSHPALSAQDLAIMYYNLGLAFNAGGDLEAAVQCYYEAKFTDPDYAPTYYNLGIAVRAQGLVDAAQAYFAAALQHDETDAKAHYNYGMCLYSIGDRRQSTFHLKRAVELQPGYGQAYYGLAKIAADKANFTKLVWYMKHAINNGVRSPKMYWRLGRALRLTGNIAGAIQYYNQALNVQRIFVPAHAFLTLEEALGLKRLNHIRAHGTKARSRGRVEHDNISLACRVLATYGEALARRAKNDIEGSDLCFDDTERDTTWCHCMVADLLWAYGEVKQAARAYQRAISRIEHEMQALAATDRAVHDTMLIVVNRRLQYTLSGGGDQEEWKRELLFCEEEMPYRSLVW